MFTCNSQIQNWGKSFTFSWYACDTKFLKMTLDPLIAFLSTNAVIGWPCLFFFRFSEKSINIDWRVKLGQSTTARYGAFKLSRDFTINCVCKCCTKYFPVRLWLSKGSSVSSRDKCIPLCTWSEMKRICIKWCLFCNWHIVFVLVAT